MIRKIIKINEEKCNGCGLCAKACHEGAIGMVNNKAKLLRDDYCDGLGNCLPVCPVGAITFEEREALEYDEKAVMENMKKNELKKENKPAHGGCPGMRAMSFKNNTESSGNKNDFEALSRLSQWPVQIKLVPVNAPYFSGADLLVAADCTAFAYGDFHNKFIKDKVTLIGCPKLDEVDYSEKLCAIISQNDINGITVARMNVPCCGGIEYAVKEAVMKSGRDIPVDVRIITTNGELS